MNAGRAMSAGPAVSAGAEERAAARLAAGCLALLALAAALLQIRSYDVWWHLAAGEQILREGAVPRVDDFSFTSRGMAWIDHEWLFQVVLALAWRGGAAGIFLMKALCAWAAAAIGYLGLRRCGASRGAALIVAAICIPGMRPRLAERPEMITLVMAAAVAALGIDLLRRPQRAGLRIAAVAGLTVLWANLHAAALVAPVILAALGAGALLEASVVSGRRFFAGPGAGAALVAAVVAAGGLLVNPYGWRILSVPASIASALAPPNVINPEWASPTWRSMPFFFAVAAVALIMGVQQVAARAPLALPRLSLLLLAIVMACVSVRQVGLFFAVLPMTFDPAWMRRSRGDKLPGGEELPRALAPAVCAGAVVAMLLVPPAGAAVGLGIQPDRFPRKAAAFVASHMPEARLYNDTAFGGWLIHAGYPQRRVFIDGRNEVHARLLQELSESLDDGRRWQEMLQRHQVEGAVVSYRQEMIAARDAAGAALPPGTWSALHFPRGIWALVWWDDVAMVFVRRAGPLGGLADSLEYRHIQPEAARLDLQAAHDPPTGEPNPDIVAEIRRKLTDDPDCRLARSLSALYGGGQTSPQR